MKITYSDLEKLSIKELSEIKNTIAFILKARLKQPSKTEGCLSLFYSVLSEEINKRVGTNYPIFEVYNKYKYKKVSIERIEKVSIYIKKFFSNSVEEVLTLPELTKCYRIYSKIICDNIENTDIPLSLSSAINWYENFPSLLDKAFPGYFKNNLLKRLI